MPSSLGSIFSIARSAIASHQLSIQVASHNIANAEVAGYHRQVADEMANYPQLTPEGVLGTGVSVGNIQRMQNRFLDDAFRSQNGLAAGSDQTKTLVSQVESIFGEPSETGLASALDAYWTSWSALANDPTDSNAKLNVRQQGASLSAMLNDFSQRLSDLTTNTRQELGTDIQEFNKQTSIVAGLNLGIAVEEAGGKSAGDLRDARDVAIDALSKMGNVRVIEQPNGSVNVLLGSTSVVDGNTSSELAISATDPSALVIKGQAERLRDIGGTLGATTDALRTTIPGHQATLDTLASTIVTTVNGLHATGWTAAAAGTGTNFFDPTGVTAATIDLSTQVKSSAAYIAAGTTVNGSGDNTLALAIGGLRNQKVTIGTTTASINEYYSNLVTDVGFQVNTAASSVTVHGTLAQQAQARRSSESGVSTDEELMSVMRFQHAYAAASKLVNVADEMAQTILAMGH